MQTIKKFLQLIDNYVLARWFNRPSTASFWYLQEPPILQSTDSLQDYKQIKENPAPRYLIDYRAKLKYSLENSDGILVLPYAKPIGLQINPEAAFQYALGLHDHYYLNQDAKSLKKFWHYVNYFLEHQTAEGLWPYNFDWYEAKAPWYSALSQARGASVMLRAWLHSKDTAYLNAAKLALRNFNQPITSNGFLHFFPINNCPYFEEYPNIPSGVINGFMAALISIWEMNYWLQETWLEELWQKGLHSLEMMLPYYTTGWWSLYDLDERSPVVNVNSPRYHLLEINYLQTLIILSGSDSLTKECNARRKQYRNPLLHLRALTLKTKRKLLYR